jgi:Ca2+-dependent lipid-binding protein
MFEYQRDRLTKAATIFADRNAMRKRVIGDEESAEWINAVLYRFWQFYEPGRCSFNEIDMW